MSGSWGYGAGVSLSYNEAINRVLARTHVRWDVAGHDDGGSGGGGGGIASLAAAAAAAASDSSAVASAAEIIGGIPVGIAGVAVAVGAVATAAVPPPTNVFLFPTDVARIVAIASGASASAVAADDDVAGGSGTALLSTVGTAAGRGSIGVAVAIEVVSVNGAVVVAIADGGTFIIAVLVGVRNKVVACVAAVQLIALFTFMVPVRTDADKIVADVDFFIVVVIALVVATFARTRLVAAYKANLTGS